MRILAVYRHYWPDTTPYARILRTLLEHFAAGGHQVAVFTAQPGYNASRHPPQPWREKVGGVDVRRMRLLPERKTWRIIRVVNWCYFLLRAAVHAVLGRRYDLIIANSHPPVLMGCLLRLAHFVRRTPYIYHCQDLHPEAAVVAGYLRRNWLQRLLLGLDAQTCRHAQQVVVLSRDMVESLRRRGLSAANVSTINNPPLATTTEDGATLPPPFSQPANATRFLFAGNLGRFQALDRLVAAAGIAVKHADFQLIFLGDGEAKNALMAQARELLNRRIFFVPYLPPETALAAMRMCHYGVVSLLAGMYQYAYPSKTMMYLSAGCPVLALVEPESEIARTIAQHDFGYVARSSSVADIADAIQLAANGRDSWTLERRLAVARSCNTLFGEARMLATWDQMLPPARRAAKWAT